MSEVEIIALGKEAVKTVLLVCAPALGLGLLVGLLVSIFHNSNPRADPDLYS